MSAIKTTRENPIAIGILTIAGDALNAANSPIPTSVVAAIGAVVYVAVVPVAGYVYVSVTVSVVVVGSSK